eukprot:jgi/Chrzof1/1245/Cz01g46050.t1
MPVLTMQIPYHAIEVNPLTKSELKWSKEYRKVPVVKLDDEVVVDSSAIISRLAAEIEAKGKPAVQPQAAKSSWFSKAPAAESSSSSSSQAEEEERRWRKWVDERLVKVITANIYRSWE